GDYKSYAFLNGIGSAVIGLIAFIYLSKNLKKVNSLRLTSIYNEFRESSVMFISNVSINLYTSSNTFILGLFAPPVIVGYWSAADKIRMAVQGILSPITQGFYPHLAHLFSQSRERAIEFIKKSFLPVGLIGFIVSFLVLVFAEPISSLLLGSEFVNSLILIKIISFLPFVILLSNFFGIQILLNLNGSREFSFTVFIAGIFNIVLSFIIVPKLLAIGTAISVMITEVIVTTLMMYFANRRLKASRSN
ncbi:MAG: oligosaccharide flippase family protein, partial [Ignavibacteria bacterium]|nr:oligosaccharide flippase family protein [Ignavibacteria bacterium]